VKVFAIDWERCLGFLERWRGLTPAARRILLGAKPKEVLTRKALGRELESLVAGGFLIEMADGLRARLSDDFHETHKVLRALERQRLLERHDGQALREYLAEHFTGVERLGLLGSDSWIPNRDERLLTEVCSVSHVRRFLETGDVRGWEAERRPRHSDASGEGEWTQSRSLLKATHAPEDLRGLIRALRDARGAVRLAALPAPGGSRARLGNSIQAGLRYLLCFPALDADLEPVLTLWPSVAARLARVPTQRPQAVEPEEVFGAVLRHDDLMQLLVRAADPLRMKRDGRSLFAGAQEELEQGLVQLPYWLLEPRLFPENGPERRIDSALELAWDLGFVEQRGEHGRSLALATTAEGMRWLRLPGKDRLRLLLERVRYDPDAGAEAEEDESSSPILDEKFEQALLELEEDLDEDSYTLQPFRGTCREFISDEALFGFSSGGQLTRAAIRAYDTLEPEQPVLLLEFIRHHVEGSNPLLDFELKRSDSWSPWGPPTEEGLEALWMEALRRLLHNHLLPYGGVRLGAAKGRGLTLELTALGRYLLALDDDFEWDEAPRGAKPVRVQPDFEVLFVSPDPALEAAISRFAERRGRGVGVLFRLTQASVVAAALAGIEAEEVLATLTGASSTPIPANVEHEIRSWSGRSRRIALERAELLRCPDEATAARVLSAAGAGKLERLTPTVLALLDPRHRAALLRQCRKAGILLEAQDEPVPARKRPKRRWRRY
jgi:hypothetical protein